MSITGETPAVRLNQDLVGSSDVTGNFMISSDSERVVFSADPNFFIEELFSVSIDGSDLVRLNSNLPTGGDVLSYAISPDSQRVVYRADQRIDNLTELYSVLIDGGPQLRISADLTGGGDVLPEFQISPDSQRLIYLADRTTNNVLNYYLHQFRPGLFGN